MSFDKLLGQEGAIKLLRDDLVSGRIHHAYLFTGKRGIGKKTLALEFARALFCHRKEGDACNQCLSCRKIEHSNHPDLSIIKIDEGDSIKIEQIRELQRGLAFKPYEGRWKIYIIEDADKMTPEAANSLLKTLEEPPKYGIIILLSREIERLLPTVISRCHTIQLNTLSAEDIEKILLNTGYDNNKEIELIASLADGSPGEALSIIKDEDFFLYRRKLYDMLYKLPELSGVDIFKVVDEIMRILNNKDEFPIFYLIMIWYRDIILYNQGSIEEIINYDYLDLYKLASEDYTLLELISIVKLVNNIKRYVNSNVKKDLAFQVMFFKIRAKRVN